MPEIPNQFPLLYKATNYAENALRGKMRKSFPQETAFDHSKRVLEIIKKNLSNPTETLLMAAILHDVPEDAKKTPQETLDELGIDSPELHSTLELLTEDKAITDFKERRKKYIDNLASANNEIAWVVSIADKIDDLQSDIRTIEFLSTHGLSDEQALWVYLGSRKGGLFDTFLFYQQHFQKAQEAFAGDPNYSQLINLYKDTFTQWQQILSPYINQFSNELTPLSQTIRRQVFQWAREINPYLELVYGCQVVPAGSVAFENCVREKDGEKTIHDLDVFFYQASTDEDTITYKPIDPAQIKLIRNDPNIRKAILALIESTDQFCQENGIVWSGIKELELIGENVMAAGPSAFKKERELLLENLERIYKLCTQLVFGMLSLQEKIKFIEESDRPDAKNDSIFFTLEPEQYEPYYQLHHQIKQLILYYENYFYLTGLDPEISQTYLRLKSLELTLTDALFIDKRTLADLMEKCQACLNDPNNNAIQEKSGQDINKLLTPLIKILNHLSERSDDLIPIEQIPKNQRAQVLKIYQSIHRISQKYTGGSKGIQWDTGWLLRDVLYGVLSNIKSEFDLLMQENIKTALNEFLNEFRLPPKLLMFNSEKQRDKIFSLLSLPPENPGIRFLPGYRCLQWDPNSPNTAVFDPDYAHQPRVNIEFHLETVGAESSNKPPSNRPIFVASTGGFVRLEKIISSSNLTVGKAEIDQPQQPNPSPPLRAPLYFDIDGTLTVGYESSLPPPHALSCLSYLAQKGHSLNLWSRSNKSRVHYFAEYIEEKTGSSFHDRVGFGNWPTLFIIIPEKAEGRSEEIKERQLDSLCSYIKSSLSNLNDDQKREIFKALGYSDLNDLVSDLFGKLINLRASDSYYSSEAKVPWFRALFNPDLSFDQRMALIKSGVLINDDQASIQSVAVFGYSLILVHQYHPEELAKILPLV